MMFDTSAYFGQPSVAPLPFAPQGLFGYLPGQQQFGGFLPQAFGIFPGQHSQPIWPTIGGGLGHPQLAGLVPQSIFGYLPGQYGQPIWPTIGGVWPGQPQLGGPLGVGLGQLGRFLPFETAWPGHPQFAGVPGRSILPYQLAPQMLAPQMTYAG